MNMCKSQQERELQKPFAQALTTIFPQVSWSVQTLSSVSQPMRRSCRYPLLKRRCSIHKAIPRNDHLGPTAMPSDSPLAQEFKTLRDTFRMFDVVNQKGVVNLESFLSVVCASEDAATQIGLLRRHLGNKLFLWCSCPFVGDPFVS